MVLYFRESNGDYLAVETGTNRYYLDTFGKDHFEGRAAAIAGLAGSVCTTGIARDYLLTNCIRVPKGKVPSAWLKTIGL